MNEFTNKLIMYHQIHKMKRDGWSISKIADFLVLNWRTVKKYLQMTEDEFFEYQVSQRQRHKELQDYEGFVKMKLDYCSDASSSQIHDWLKEHYADFPDVAPKTVFNFVQWVRQKHNIPKIKQTREFFLVEELPYGKQAQVDFGEYNMRNGKGKRVKVYFFTMVLSRSRYKFVYFSQSPFTTSLAITAHQKAFEYFGGIPEEIVYDQDSVFIHDENKGDLILTEKFREYCNTMPFNVHFCRQSDPQSKGKVENVVKYVKQNFLYNRPFADIETLNKEALGWLKRTGNGMPHNFTKQKPYDMWLEEKPYLKPFTTYALEQEQKMYTVRIDNSILFKGNYYSVPQGTYKGRDSMVKVYIENDRLVISDKHNNPICSHALCTDRGRKISNTDHKRDKSASIDNLLLETAMEFPEYEEAKNYLQKIREKKSRYVRDQLGAIRQAIAPVAPKAVTDTLMYCISNAIYSASDFIAVLESQPSFSNEKVALEKTQKIQSPLAKNITELNPQTSDIFEYEQLMKN